MQVREKIAVVGGGSVGLSFIVQLVDDAISAGVASNVDVLLFEPHDVVGPGDAYGADFACNLLNTRADTMSAISNNKRHFLEWLESNQTNWRSRFPDVKIGPGEFLPRNLFGQYLSWCYTQALERAEAHGMSIIHVADTVVDIIPISEMQFCIDSNRSGGFVVNRVVLSPGNLPSTTMREMRGLQGYFHSPYPCRDMVEAIPRGASVGIIGSSLSAIDTVLSLREAGHTGQLVCVSRNGRLPSVRGISNKSHVLKVLSREWIDQTAERHGGVLPLAALFGGMIAEYELATGRTLDIDQILNSGKGMVHYLDEEVSLASSTERVWQSIIYATNGMIDYAWHKMSPEDKRLFEKQYRSQWLAYRVSFPLVNAIRIQQLLGAEQLRVFGGAGDVTWDASAGKFQLPINDKRTGLESTIACDYVVNATCFGVDVTRTDVPIVRNLLRRGIAVPHEFGGFQVSFETGALIDKAGRELPRFTVLGSLSTGVYFWTNAMDVNARLAAGQALRIVRAIRNDKLVAFETSLPRPTLIAA